MADSTVESRVQNNNNLIIQIVAEINGINKDIDAMNATRDRLLTTVEQLNNVALYLRGLGSQN